MLFCQSTLPFAVRFNVTAGGGRIVDADKARIAHIKAHGASIKAAEKAGAAVKRAGAFSFAVTNTAVTYTTSVGVGSPATQYDLLIDTGSSNTWLGADKKYVKTSTSSSTGKSVSVTYVMIPGDRVARLTGPRQLRLWFLLRH